MSEPSSRASSAVNDPSSTSNSSGASAAALDIPAAKFGLTATAVPILDATAGPEGDDVHRRELLAGLAAMLSVSLLPQPRTAEGSPLHAIPRLRSSLASCRAQFARCDYRTLDSSLPQLLADSHHNRTTAPEGRARDLTSSVLADSYSLAAALAHKLGDRNRAWIFADRAQTLARASGQSSSIAEAARQLVVAIRHVGYRSEAAKLITTAVSDLRAIAPSDLDALGGLLLTAAYTVAGCGNATDAYHLVDEARVIATLLPAHSPAAATFGPLQVDGYEIGIHNTLGDSATALTVARRIPWTALPTPARRARVAIDTARAWYLLGDIARCAAALTVTERCAPQPGTDSSTG